jgi:acetate kinase
MLLWLLEHEGISERDLGEGLEHQSGLRGLAGSADMRAILSRADAGDADAVLALDVYVHRLLASIGSMVAALGGVDVIAFTGGIGERAPAIRSRAAAGLAFLGVAIDEAANASLSSDDADLSAPGAAVRTVALHAREDLEIAHQVRGLLGG